LLLLDTLQRRRTAGADQELVFFLFSKHAYEKKHIFIATPKMGA